MRNSGLRRRKDTITDGFGKEEVLMRTRAEIYGKEAAGLLRAISLYPGILEEQLCRFHPGKEDVARNLLAHLKRQGRVVETDEGRYFPYGMDVYKSDAGMGQAVWVLLDFVDRVEFHVPGDFPVQIVFFSGGEFYEIVHAALGQEALVNHAMGLDREGGSRRIVLVDEPGQIPTLEFPGIIGYCTVASSGKVSYYKKQ